MSQVCYGPSQDALQNSVRTEVARRTGGVTPPVVHGLKRNRRRALRLLPSAPCSYAVRISD